MNIFEKHRKEILAHVQNLKDEDLQIIRPEGEWAVINGMDLGLRGKQIIQCRVPRDVRRALEGGDLLELMEMLKRATQRMIEGRSLDYVPLQMSEQWNTWFNEGITEMLDVNFRNQTQHASHYFLIGNLDVTPAVGWTSGTGGTKIRTTFGEVTDYTYLGNSSNRPTWTPDAAATQAIENSTTGAVIVCTGTDTIRGACLMTAQPKDGSGDNTGYAWAGSRAATDLPAASTYEFTFKHELSGSAS